MRDCKTDRILTIYDRLCKGEFVNKHQLSKEMTVNEKTIQRDLDDIRSFCSENYEKLGFAEIRYDSKKKGYCLVTREEYFLKNDEILAISKILLESRAFNKQELNLLLDKLIVQSSPNNRKTIKDIISNERHHYIPLHHNSLLMEKIWQLSTLVRAQELIKVKYMRMNKNEFVERVIKPVGIIFSEYYFYLTAYIEGANHDYPTLYRLDRIIEWVPLNEGFKINIGERFEEGEFRKRIQFMHPGDLMKIQFRYWGSSVEAVLDRLPTARIVGEDGSSKIIEAEVFGVGIKMWLLSQGEYLEIVKPEKLREEMCSSVMKMVDIYTNSTLVETKDNTLRGR